MAKKVISLGLILTIILSLAGCYPERKSEQSKVAGFYTLTTAYEKGWISKTDLKNIAGYYNGGNKDPEPLNVEIDIKLRQAYIEAVKSLGKDSPWGMYLFWNEEMWTHFDNTILFRPEEREWSPYWSEYFSHNNITPEEVAITAHFALDPMDFFTIKRYFGTYDGSIVFSIIDTRIISDPVRCVPFIQSGVTHIARVPFYGYYGNGIYGICVWIEE